MKVSLHPSDETGCGFYRIREPARVAAAEGIETEVVDRRLPLDFVPWQPDRNMVRLDREIGIVPRDPEVQVVVLQRVCSARIVQLIPVMQHLGMAVIIDIDDDFTCLQPSHPAFHLLNPAGDPSMNWHNALRACRLADLVTVPAEVMADRYAGHGRYAVLPNRVPGRLLDMPRTAAGDAVGWAGMALVHPGDLAVTRGGVADALARTGAHFKVIGPPEGAQEQLALAQEPASTGGLPLEDYYTALGTLDVGIVPLADIRFNAGKGHKGLELAARGVPFVASPVAQYPRLAEEGVGVLAADRARNWRAALTRLISDETLRAEMADQGREVIADQHTYEQNGWRWAEAWQQARSNYLARRRTAIAA